MVKIAMLIGLLAVFGASGCVVYDRPCRPARVIVVRR